MNIMRQGVKITKNKSTINNVTGVQWTLGQKFNGKGMTRVQPTRSRVQQYKEQTETRTTEKEDKSIRGQGTTVRGNKRQEYMST